jgi:hypothetical protein
MAGQELKNCHVAVAQGRTWGVEVEVDPYVVRVEALAGAERPTAGYESLQRQAHLAVVLRPAAVVIAAAELAAE